MAECEKLSWDQIKMRFSEEWVVLTQSTLDDNDDIIEGVLYFHSSNLEQAIAKWGECPDESWLEFIGTPRYRRVSLSVDGIDKRAA